jgi:DNA mismatch repair ATPase MutS
MMTLEKESPQQFINVSMEAIEVKNREYQFPYRLKRGPSTQCIAIELLLSHGFPLSLMESAIKWKKIIYEEKSND